jgi:hypothetical protein
MKRSLIISLLLMLSVALCAQWHIDQNFDSITTIPPGWTIADDGDGMTWRNLNNASHAYSGNRAAFADNYLPNQNADWLITSQIAITAGDSLLFQTRSWTSTENLKVYVSTSGNLPVNMTQQLANIQGIGTAYQAVRLSLNQYAGTNIYIGFFWQCVNYGILIDDVKVGKPLIVTPELNLPEQISFFQGESVQMDFSQYAVYTDIQTASLGVTPITPLNVVINGLQVNISSPDYHGTQDIVFTLTDGSTGWTASDTLRVVVAPVPAVDLAIQGVSSPRATEYLNMPFTPEIEVANYGQTTFNDQFELSLEIRDASGTVVDTQNLFHTAQINPQQSIHVMFPNVFSPASVGAYSFNFQILRAEENMANNSIVFACNVVLRITSGGPDAFGYRFVDSNDPLGPEFNWIDISATGTSAVMYNVPTWSGDDNFSAPVPLGFTFPFYGSQYSTAHIDINGEILLAGNNWYTEYPSQGWDNDGNMFNYMYPIPGYAQMPGLIAAYWDDLEADQGIGNVYFQSFGESPNQYTIIQWHNLRYHAGTGGSPILKFQVILHENGEIVMQYHTVSTGQSGSVVPHNEGLSSTIAIQNEAANAGLCYLREIVQNSTYIGVEPAGNLLHDNLAIRFYSGVDAQPPIMTHKAVGNTFQQDVVINATIIDMSPLTETTLHYNHGTGWLSIPASGSASNQYLFNMIDLPLGCTVVYYFVAEDAVGNVARLPLAGNYSFKILPIANTQALILYSGSQDYQRVELPIYEALLTELNIPYDLYNWEEYPDYYLPDSYKGIIAYANTGGSGDKANTLALALVDYLNRGTVSNPHNLWFASDGWASNQHGHPDSSPLRKLMSGYFRTSYVPTGPGGGTNGLAGPDSYTYQNGSILCLPGSPIGTPDTEYLVYANSPDCIFPNNSAGDPYWDEVPYPEIGANYVFAFEDGPINGHAYLYHGVCGTAVATPSYKTFYFSFDFSQLTSAAARHQWMEDLTDWFGLSPVASSDELSPLYQTGFSNIFPNPFNPTTTISFNMAKAEPLSLAIFNLKGQKVTQLVQDSKAAGKHSIVWNGTDFSGKSVASGIYYIKLETPTKRETRKLTLIK